MAAGDSQRCIRNAPYRVLFDIRNTAGSLVSSATNLDSEIIKDSAAPSDCTNEATEVGSSGIYYLDLTATEMTVAGDASITCSSTEGNTSFERLPIEPSLESGVAAAATANSITLRSSLTGTADDQYIGAQIEIVRGTGQGQVRGISDYVASTRIVTVGRAWVTNPDAASVYQIHRQGAQTSAAGRYSADVVAVNNDTTIADAMLHAYQGGFVQGSVDDASPTTTSFVGASGLSATDDFYNNAILTFVTGNLQGLSREITDYTGSTLTLTTGAWPVAPANGDEFFINGRVF